MAEVSEGVEVEDLGTLYLGDTIKVFQERTVALGPVAGSLLVDMQQEIEELHEQYFEQLDAKGIGTVRVYERAEWTGVFTYEVEIHLHVVLLYDGEGRQVEHLAGGHVVIYAVIVFVVAGGVWISQNGVTITGNVVKAQAPFTVFGVALFIGALAFLVYQLRKYRSLGKAIGAT